VLKHIAALALIPCSLSAQAPLKTQIDSLHAAMVAAFAADPASTTKFYTDDAAVVGGGMRVVGRAGVDNYWKQISPGSTWQLEVLDVGGIPEAPWVHGRSTLRSGSGRTSITEYIGLLQRGLDGQLRFRVDAYAGGQASAAPGDEAAVRKLDSLWSRMYATHDTASALQLYAESLVFIGSGGQHKTRADELGDVRPSGGLRMEYFRSTPAAVRTFERVSIVQGTAEWSFSMGGGSPRKVERPYSAIYRRGGPLGWTIVAMQMGDGRVARGR
jgi:ketosteroid isomerase-like protein